MSIESSGKTPLSELIIAEQRLGIGAKRCSEDIEENYIGTIVTIDSVRYCSNVQLLLYNYYCTTTVTIGTITYATKPYDKNYMTELN